MQKLVYVVVAICVLIPFWFAIPILVLFWLLTSVGWKPPPPPVGWPPGQPWPPRRTFWQRIKEEMGF